MWDQTLDGEDPQEEGMATHFRILAWRVPLTEEPGRLQSLGSQRQTQLKGFSMHAHIAKDLCVSDWLAEGGLLGRTSTEGAEKEAKTLDQDQDIWKRAPSP